MSKENVDVGVREHRMGTGEEDVTLLVLIWKNDRSLNFRDTSSKSSG